MERDPICRMEVREEEAVTAECDGITYYFCSEGCRDKFLREKICARKAFDLIIIGGGPAGLTAAVYAAPLLKLNARKEIMISPRLLHFASGDFYRRGRDRRLWQTHHHCFW
ncbi:MAG: YHS domain-containing protein [Pseudomonadota bacterium]